MQFHYQNDTEDNSLLVSLNITKETFSYWIISYLIVAILLLYYYFFYLA